MNGLLPGRTVQRRDLLPGIPAIGVSTEVEENLSYGSVCPTAGEMQWGPTPTVRHIRIRVVVF